MGTIQWSNDIFKSRIKKKSRQKMFGLVLSLIDICGQTALS